MKKVRICLLTTVHYTFDTRIFHRQAKSLARAGYDVTLISQHSKNETVDGVNIIALPKPKNRIHRIFFLTLRMFFLAYRQKAAVYHFHDPELTGTCLLLKLFTSARVVYDIHEDIPKQILSKYWIPTYLKPVVSNLFNLFERIIVGFFDAIIVAGSDIANRFPSSNNINTIRNFPPIEVLKHPDYQKKKNSDSIKLIYAGSLTEDRGIKQTVQAIQLIRDNIQLQLIGNFYDSSFQNDLIKKADKRVEFIEKVPYEKLFDYLNDADIGLILFHPSPNNMMAISGRNNKIYEYMSAGLPILASALPGWREIIEDSGIGIVVNPLNLEDIARGIKKLIDDPELRIKMGKKGRQYFLEKYNWKKEEEAFLNIYTKLLRKTNS